MSALVSAAWRYRGFVVSSIKGEFRSRLARSRFGTAWIVLQPLAQVLIFATILSSVLGARLQDVDNKYGYAAYLLAGLLCWSFFAEIFQRCLTVFIDQASLLKKMQFPRIALPLVVIGSALVSNVVLVVVTLAILPILGFHPGVEWLWLPVLVLLTAAFATGLGLLLGTLNVFARDIGQVMVVVLQLWFWVTPVVYPVSIVPERFKAALVLNPMASLVGAYEDVLIYGRAPSSLWIPCVVACVLLVLSLVVFRRASPELVDAL
jgi:ABC-type polysaccharide/polyol phosphate export systems, permease component